jgi:hypothetical protein
MCVCLHASSNVTYTSVKESDAEIKMVLATNLDKCVITPIRGSDDDIAVV